MVVIDIKTITRDPHYSTCRTKNVPSNVYFINYLTCLYKLAMQAISFLDPADRPTIAVELMKGPVSRIVQLNTMSIPDRLKNILSDYSILLDKSDIYSVKVQRITSMYLMNNLPKISNDEAEAYARHKQIEDIEAAYGLPFRYVRWEKYFSLKELELGREYYDTTPVTLPFEVADYEQGTLHVFGTVTTAPNWGKVSEEIRESRQNASDLSNVLQHVDQRFADLDHILTHRYKAVVVFPGNSPSEHRLGTGIAAGAWKNKSAHKKLIDHIADKIQALQNKYQDRVQFGMVGFRELIDPKDHKDSRRDPSLDFIHVWGANDSNWNTKNSTSKRPLGSGQASVLYQAPGVFGIVTMPTSNKSILDPDVNLSHYLAPLPKPYYPTPENTFKQIQFIKQLEAQEAQKQERQRLEAQKLEAQKLEAQKLEAQKQERQRLEAQKLEAQKQEQQKQEQEQQKQERQRLEAQKLEQQKLEAQKLEAQKLEAQKERRKRLTESYPEVGDRIASKYVAQGSYGCVYTPNVRCVGEVSYDRDGLYSNLRSGKLVSKIFRDVDPLNLEIRESKIIGDADPDEKYHYGPKAVCKVNQPKAASKCTIMKKTGEAYQIIYENGGPSLDMYIQQVAGESNKDVNLAKSKMKALFLSFSNLIEGAAIMRRKQMSHFDIKPVNIVVKEVDGGVVTKFIDFGLTKKWETVLKEDVPYLARTYTEESDVTIEADMPKYGYLMLNSYVYAPYPVETCFLRKDFYNRVCKYLKTYSPEEMVERIFSKEPTFGRRYDVVANARAVMTNEVNSVKPRQPPSPTLSQVIKVNMISVLSRIKKEGYSTENFNKLRRQILESLDLYSVGITIMYTLADYRMMFKTTATPEDQEFAYKVQKIAQKMCHTYIESRCSPEQALTAWKEL